jgi:Holliday junction resolvase RusA-like endonuclease
MDVVAAAERDLAMAGDLRLRRADDGRRGGGAGRDRGAGVTPVLDFWVPGHPKTKGSLQVVNSGRLSGRAVLRDTPASKRWRQLVAYAAGEAMKATSVRTGLETLWPLAGPVSLTLTYYLPVDEAALIAQGSGDIDKLERNIFDALQDAGVYANDAQVVDCWHGKRVPIQGGVTGVMIKVAMVDGFRI